MKQITVKVERPFLFGRKARQVGERVELDAATANDLIRRERASIPSEDEPAAPAQAPARAAKAKRS